jgi:hypothetical protein
VRNELRDALHHPVARPLAADVDVTVVRVSNEAVSPALQLPVKFVEHDVAEQWRTYSSNAKGNFQFERVIVGWRSHEVLDLRRK